jgi:pyrimidine-specific ribonucleoside hydrolase
MVIDTDMAPDDWMAIVYLLQRPDVDVRAITVTGTGEAHCGPGVQNALDLAALVGRPDVPVACGRETPLQGDHVFPQGWRDWSDALAGLTLAANPNPPASQDAVSLLTSTVLAAPEEVVLVTLGPLTNVAEALQAEPELADALAEIIIMGGAFDVPGNIGQPIENTAAEWNIYVDPYAAARVVESGAPVTFVPLDATDDCPLTVDFYNRIAADHTTPAAEFIYRLLYQQHDFILSGDYYFWDPLTAAIATDESLATFEDRTAIVIEEEGPESGATRTAEDGSPVRVAISADRERFEALFIDVLNGRVDAGG